MELFWIIGDTKKNANQLMHGSENTFKTLPLGMLLKHPNIVFSTYVFMHSFCFAFDFQD